LTDALATLGPTFVGVVNIAETTGDDELLGVAEAGVRAVRFNLYRGGSAEIGSVLSLGRRAWDLAGMHVEFYLDANDLVDCCEWDGERRVAPWLPGAPTQR